MWRKTSEQLKLEAGEANRASLKVTCKAFWREEISLSSCVMSLCREASLHYVEWSSAIASLPRFKLLLSFAHRQLCARSFAEMCH